MIRHSRYLPIALVALAFTMASCDGSDDDIETDIFTTTATFSLNADDVAFTDFVASIRYGIPQITANVVENGAVLVFIEDLEGTWTALPYSYGIEAVDQPVVDYTVSIGYAYDRQILDVFVEASSSDEVVWNEILSDQLLAATRLIRIVIFNTYIQGKNSVDLTDYEALRRHYNLPE